MLSYIVYEPDEGMRALLLACVDRCAQKCGAKLRLLAQTGMMDVAESFLKAEKGPVFLLVGVRGAGCDGAQLGEAALSINRDSYVVYGLHPDVVLSELIQQLSRPAGFLPLPPEDSRFEGLLKRISADYEALFAGGDPSELLTLQRGSELFRMPIHHVRFIEAAEKKIMFYTREQCIGVYDNLNRIAKMLEGRFVRCHRSYLVNPEHISGVDFVAMTVMITGGVIIPLSRSFRGTIREHLSAPDAVSLRPAGLPAGQKGAP